MINEIIKVNTGKATHIGMYHETVKSDGSKRICYYVKCGSFSNGNVRNEIVTGLDMTLENVTCKKCRKLYDEVAEVEKDNTMNNEWLTERIKMMTDNIKEMIELGSLVNKGDKEAYERELSEMRNELNKYERMMMDSLT